MQPQLAEPRRNAAIDAARAIGIVLVVIGHARGCPPWLASLLYSFHVPLFFWLAGAVVSDARLTEGLGLGVRRLARSLLLPYAFFFAGAYLYWLATRGIGDKAARWGARPWWEPLQGLVSGQGDLLYVDPALWFLPALFVTACAYLLLRRRVGAAAVALGAAAFALLWCALFPQAGWRLPFALDVLPAALVFYAWGQWLRGVAGQWHGGVLALLLVAAVWLAAALANGRVDLNQLRFGNWVGLYFVAAAAGIALVTLLAQRVRPNRVVDWLATNTLLIFASHMVTFSVLSGVAAVAGWRTADAGFGWALASSAIAILICVPLRALLGARMPWALGLRAPVAATPAGAV